MTEIYEANGFTEDEEVNKLLKIVPALQAEDVANAVLYVLGTPPNVQVHNMSLFFLSDFWE